MSRHLNLPHPAQHGEFVPGKGWYDANNRWWRQDPKALSALAGPPTPDEGKRAEFERMQQAARGDFRVNAQLEQLRKLRDSDLPEQRAKAEKMLEGRLRMNLADYESSKRKHLAEGNTLPEGATSPDGE